MDAWAQAYKTALPADDETKTEWRKAFTIQDNTITDMER